MTPTPRLAYVLIGTAVILVALGPLVGSIGIAAAVAGFAVDIFAVRKPPTVTRSMPQLMQRQHPAALKIDTTPSGSGRVTIRQPSVPDLAIDLQTAPGSLETAVTAIRRGRHTLPPIAVRSTGPLGLGAWQHEVGSELDVTVYPDVVGARRIARSVAMGRFSPTGKRRRGALGLGTEFESIRDYTPGDDIRQVNWRATMRTGRPMTNVYRIDQDRDVISLIDMGRLMMAPIASHTRLDVAVDAAAAIAHTADAIGDRCGVIAFEREVRRMLPPRRRGADAVVEVIHDLEPTSRESNYEIAFRTVGRAKRSLVVVFTDLLEEAAAQPLLEAMPVLARRHAVIVATTRDDDLRDAVTTPPTAATDVYRAVVALDALRARKAVVTRLRHAGATVIEASATSLPAAAVAAYLDLKQRAAV